MNIEKRKEEIAARVKTERENQSLTRAALAEIAELSASTIGNIESSAALTVANILQVSEALYVPASYLLGEEEELQLFEQQRTRELELEAAALREKVKVLEQEKNRMEADYKAVKEAQEENRKLKQYEWIVRKVQTAVRDV